MAEITVPAKKFQRLFDYMERIGINAQTVAATVDLRQDRIEALAPDYALPALHYSRLYKAAAEEMQQLKQGLPWAAGLGSEAFELMCHCMIGAHTLRDALQLAERFDSLLFSLNGYRVRLLEDAEASSAKLSYEIDVSGAAAVLIPEDWDRVGSGLTAARASGLLVWHSLCGWLIGQALTASELRINAPVVNQDYHDSLARTINGPVYFDADENTCSFDQALLDHRIVHTPASLADFMKNSVYHLIAMDRVPASTSAAIKSLVSIDLPNGMPSFANVASMLYMSESSLRRRLQAEKTSYQAIKDEVRCQVAIDKLLREDARVVDLAEFLGFTEPSSFVRSFKSWTGYTPKAYKDRVLELGRS
ncbi:MAG: AraC family transcriptional regulator ligand-binding domain-containing protein [Halioglobus sp.]|nr:AraC family transcriptional regulator ligand-binding domain-containing protein [Halioglobus sp.]